MPKGVVGKDGVVVSEAMLDGSENPFVIGADAVKAEIRGRKILALRLD